MYIYLFKNIAHNPWNNNYNDSIKLIFYFTNSMMLCFTLLNKIFIVK